jgi:hypothetical protein
LGTELDRDQSALEIAAADLICATLTFQSSLVALHQDPLNFSCNRGQARQVAAHRLELELVINYLLVALMLSPARNKTGS